jgi:hypothetical protein
MWRLGADCYVVLGELVEAVERETGFGFRWGSFYSVRLAEEVLGVEPVDGVVRVSMVHYNTGKFSGSSSQENYGRG